MCKRRQPIARVRTALGDERLRGKTSFTLGRRQWRLGITGGDRWWLRVEARDLPQRWDDRDAHEIAHPWRGSGQRRPGGQEGELGERCLALREERTPPLGSFSCRGSGVLFDIDGCAGKSDQLLQMRTRSGERERRKCGRRSFESIRELCQCVAGNAARCLHRNPQGVAQALE